VGSLRLSIINGRKYVFEMALTALARVSRWPCRGRPAVLEKEGETDMRIRLGLGSLALSTLMLAWPGTAHAAGATVTRFPVTLEVFPNCTNENVRVTGVFTIVVQTSVDSAGVSHNLFHTSLDQGKGTGETTGFSYVMPETFTTFDVLGPASVVAEVINTNLIGVGSVPNQNVQIHTQLTVDAQGNVTASFVDAEATCT
jgi:hypothetical protein